MRRFCWFLGACAFFLPALAFAGPIKTEDVTFKSGDETVTGYRAEAAADAWKRMVEFFRKNLK